MGGADADADADADAGGGVMAKRGGDVVKWRGIDVGRRTNAVTMRLETRSVQGRLRNLMVVQKRSLPSLCTALDME